MFTKKEIIIAILMTLLFGGIIFFLPTIENTLSNRKDYEYDEEEKAKKVVDKYVCTFSSKSNVLDGMIEVTFTIDQDKVTRIYSKQSKTYTKKEDFENASREVKENIKTDTVEEKTTLDNINYTIITVRGENVTSATKSEYPLSYQELTKYLDKNNYTCTIRYKK